MHCGTEDFQSWQTRIFLHLSAEHPDLASYFTTKKGEKPSTVESNQFASVLVPHLADDLFHRFRRDVISSVDHISIDGFKLWDRVCTFFSNTSPLEEIPEELFGRHFRQCFRDKFPSVAAFVRAAHGIVQATESAASASLPVLERIMALHVLSQLSMNDFCPWAATLLADYRKAYRDSPALDSVPKGFTLNNIVETVIGHLAVAPGARDPFRGRFTDRPLCSFCNTYGHTEDKCRKRQGKQKGAATGTRPGARVNTLAADGPLSAYDDDDIPQYRA